MQLPNNGRTLRAKICGLLAGTLFVGIGTCAAQNLSQVARRDRERAKDHPATHVYTNEDMQRQEILVPSDRNRTEEVNSDPYRKYDLKGQRHTSQPAQVPLGDVARHYRWLKEQETTPSPIMVRALPGGPTLASPELTLPTHKPALRPLPETPAPNAPVNKAVLAARSVRAKRGDSLWRLAAEFLGSGKLWRKILSVNPNIKNANLIEIGQIIHLPGKVAAAQSARQWRVRSGDSLWKIASTELGSGSAWRCIAQANPQIANPNLIYASQVLVIPAACSGNGSQVSNLRPRKFPRASLSR